MKVITRSLVATALALATVACSGPAAPVGPSPSAAPAGYPVTVASCGRDFSYAKPPSRVVLGYPGTLDTLTALGVQNSVHGYVLGSLGKLPAGAPDGIVQVSPDYTPSRESMVGARPDLFLGNDEGQLTGEGTVSYEDLAGIGAGVYIMGGYCAKAPAGRTLATIEADVTSLGRIFGVEDKVRALNQEIETRVARAKASLNGKQLRIAYVQSYNGKLYANSGYPAATIIEALGQVNEFDDLKQSWAEISREDALRRKPDVLIVNVSDGKSEAAVAEISKTLAGTKAVAAGHVLSIDGGDFEAGGVSVIRQLEEVAAQLATL
ncbi:MAG: ABC transporter substrate-binding protein [Micropruina sp.]|uniref:ABC transporter substrate-binding protein n=1 Tax=Micropruina sp. TaxID=2737536 RepID=UPI0039E281C8